MINFFANLQNSIYSKIGFLDGVPLLALRLFLAPVMIVAGWTKFENLSGIAQFFSSVGIPFAEIMAPLAAAVELIGGILLLAGLGVRLIAIPLAVTMIVAALTVHWKNGWFAIAPTSADHSPARVVAMLGVSQAKLSLEKASENKERLDVIRSLVDAHPRSQWLKENGRVAIVQSGVEYAVTYFIMLLTLAFYGGGRFLSLDYYLCRNCSNK